MHNPHQIGCYNYGCDDIQVSMFKLKGIVMNNFTFKCIIVNQLGFRDIMINRFGFKSIIVNKFGLKGIIVNIARIFECMIAYEMYYFLR